MQRFASNAQELSALLGRSRRGLDTVPCSERPGNCRVYPTSADADVASVNEFFCPQTRTSGSRRVQPSRQTAGGVQEDNAVAEEPSHPETDGPPDDSYFSPVQLGRGVETCFSGASARTYAQERASREKAWKARLNASREYMVSYSAAVNELLCSRAALLLEAQQAAFIQAAALHACCCVLHEPAPLEISTRSVTWIALGAVRRLQVPTFQCGSCNVSWEAAPESIGCFPSAPQQGQFWFDDMLLQLFHELTTGPAGCSGTAFVAAINSVNQFEAAGNLNDRIFLESYQHHRHAARQLADATAMGVHGLDKGAFGHCPGCAVVPGQAAACQLTGNPSSRLHMLPTASGRCFVVIEALRPTISI